MKPKILIITFISLLYSCNNQPFIQGGIETKDTIDMKDIRISDDLIPLSEIISQVTYHPLPTERDYLIGEINKIMVTDSLFFIVDKQITHSVYILSKDKKWKSRIHHHGNGPTEYLQLSDAFYDEENQEIGVYCNLSSKIYYYRPDGEFIRVQKIPYNGEMVQPVKGNKIILHTAYRENHQLKDNNMYPNLILMDSDNTSHPQCSNYFKESVRRDIVWNSNSWFTAWDDTVCIKPDHGNIVYHGTANGIYPAHCIDFGKSNVDERYWDKATQSNMKIDKLEEFCQLENLCEIIWYLENDKFIYFTCKQQGHLYQILFSKRTKKYHIITNLVNDIDMYAKFRPKAIRGNKLYGTIPAYEVAQLRNIVFAADTPEPLLSVEEGDNPVIIELTLKDF